jgi:replication initiator protein RepSA
MLSGSSRHAEYGGGTYARLLAHLAALGYRGHPITKSRGYSVTFGQIRHAKRLHRSRPAGLQPDADMRELLDEDDEIRDGFEIISSWGFVGQGYLELNPASDAVRSAALSRFRRASDLDAKIGHHKEGSAMSWKLVEGLRQVQRR